jgi:hypothetical protein
LISIKPSRQSRDRTPTALRLIEINVQPQALFQGDNL